MNRLAAEFRVSTAVLVALCKQAGVPTPAAGYWMKREFGKAPPIPALPACPDGISEPLVVEPRPDRKVTSSRVDQEAPRAPATQLATSGDQLQRRQAESVVEPVPPSTAKADLTSGGGAPDVTVRSRLVRPHSVIAKWLAEHAEASRRARADRSEWGAAWRRPDFTVSDRRQHLLLDALFKALEKQGAKVVQGERNELYAEISGEKVSFALREKHKQVRRPLTVDEQRWSGSGDKGWRQELQPTGALLFEIKTYLPGGLRRQWLETTAKPMDALLAEIAAAIVEAGPALARQTRTRREHERLAALEQQRRYALEQQRKRDENRVRAFTRMAADWHELQSAREFLHALRAQLQSRSKL